MANDPAMLGQTSYPRSPLDFYPTEPRCTEAFLEVFEDDLEGAVIWEPACGDGAISKVLADKSRGLISTDIAAYEGFDPDGLFDFFKFEPTGKAGEIVGAEVDGHSLTEEELAGAIERGRQWKAAKLLNGEWPPEGWPGLALDDLEALGHQRPDTIITNPPYDQAAAFVRHALKIMEPENGFVAVLCRSDWDCAKGRKDLFKNHPAFAAKVVLNFRPVWVPKTKDSKSPRFTYAWYVWDFRKALMAPGVKPELHYAG